LEDYTFVKRVTGTAEQLYVIVTMDGNTDTIKFMSTPGLTKEDTWAKLHKQGVLDAEILAEFERADAQP
jgi:hypothetical protein